MYTAETEDVSLNRMQDIKEKLKQQTRLVADNFQHGLILIEMNPNEHQLQTKELQDQILFLLISLHKLLSGTKREHS